MIRRTFIRRTGGTAIIAGLCPGMVLADSAPSMTATGIAPGLTLLAAASGQGGRPVWKVVPRFSPRVVVDDKTLLRVRVPGLFDAGSGTPWFPTRSDRICVAACTGSLVREHRFELWTAAGGRINGRASRIHALAPSWQGFTVSWTAEPGNRFADGREPRLDADYARVRIAAPGRYALLIARPGGTPRFDNNSLGPVSESGWESQSHCPLRPVPELAGMLCLPIVVETLA